MTATTSSRELLSTIAKSISENIRSEIESWSNQILSESLQMLALENKPLIIVSPTNKFAMIRTIKGKDKVQYRKQGT